MENQENKGKNLFGVLIAWKGLGEMPRDHLTDMLIGFEIKYPISVYPIRNQEDYKNFLKTKERISRIELVIVKTGDEPVICANPVNFYDENYEGVWKNARRERVYHASREGFKQQTFAALGNYCQQRDTIKLLDLKNDGERFVRELESTLQSVL